MKKKAALIPLHKFVATTNHIKEQLQAGKSKEAILQDLYTGVELYSEGLNMWIKPPEYFMSIKEQLKAVLDLVYASSWETP